LTNFLWGRISAPQKTQTDKNRKMKKIDLKSKIERGIINTNIEVVLMNTSQNEIQESIDWYREEYIWCENVAHKFKTSQVKIAGLYAAFSPMKSVPQNKELVLEFLSSSDQTCRHLKTAVQKARLITNVDMYNPAKYIAEILNGLKTKAFFYSLIQENGHVAIDRHMLKLAPTHWEKVLTPKRYQLLSECVNNAAINSRYGSASYQKQAVLWSKLKTISCIEELNIN
jgi:hypothetical protein